MRALKTFVIVMGILILAGLGVVVVTIVKRSQERPATAEAPAASAAGVVEERRVAVPAGSRVVETLVQGERLVLRLSAADGSERLVIVDLTSGEPVATVVIGPAP